MAVATASVQDVPTHDLTTPVTTRRESFHLPQRFPPHQSQVSHVKTPSQDQGKSAVNENLLVVSPYTAREHLLDLGALQPNQQLLARALTIMRSVDDKYATTPYHTAFNWPEVVDNLRRLAQSYEYAWSDQHFYIVVFRSQVPPTTDRGELGELDRISHIEASKSGGLLKYWFGTPDVNGRNLATCIWRDIKDAKPASSGQGHKAATRATMSMYTEWKIERLKFIIRGDASGAVADWAIEQWEN